jgi:hypothetical protein
MPFCKLEPHMRAALLSLCLVFVVGCKVPNPHFCEDKDNMLCDKPDAAPMKCQVSSDCTDDPNKEICEAMECVQCTAMDTSACEAMTPVCNTTSHSCQGCKKHADCPLSDACMPDGSCAVPTSVLYVTQNATDTTSCAKETPCGNVIDALAVAGGKSIVRVKGTIISATIAINNRNLTFLGDPDPMGPTSILNRTTGDVMSVDGSSKVRLYDMQIASAAGNIGINVSMTHTGELELQRCLVTGNDTGIQNASSSLVTINRSTVSRNDVGGIVLVGTVPKFDITNNFVFRNGDANGSPNGGITIDGVSAGIPARLEFNTIVDNDASSGGSRSGGVQCTITGFPAPNNLIARNALDNVETALAQVNGGCNFDGSLKQLDLTNLNFAQPDTAPYDYHLRTGNTGIDMATTGTLMFDVDGEARPNGVARDMGADELYP